MRSLCLSIVLLVFTTVASANSSKWTGWVYWTFQGSGPKCLAELSLNETPSTFHRVGGFIDCDIVTMEVSEQILTKIGDKLFLDQEEVGIFQDGTYKWTERYSQEVVIENTIIVNGSNMDYQERWIQADGRDLYNIKGRLFKK